MNEVVIDASAIMAVILPDEQGPMAELVLATLERATITVPQHWPLEVANAILSAWRRKRLVTPDWHLTTAKAGVIAATATVHPAATTDSLVTLAVEQGLTAYDAAYVDLARRLGCPLLTGDQQMKRAAKALAISVIV